MRSKRLKAGFEQNYQAAKALVPSSKPAIEMLNQAVLTAVIRSDKIQNPPAHHELMVDLLGFYMEAVRRTREQGPGAKYHDTQLAHALFAPLRDIEDADRSLAKEDVESFVKDMREGGFDRFLLGETRRLTNRLEKTKLVHH